MAGLLESESTRASSASKSRPARSFRLRRPLQAQMPRFRGGISLQIMAEYTVGWEGVTEADVLPPGVGGDGKAEFSQDIVFEVLGDKADWYEAAAKGMADAIKAFLDQQAATAKTDGPAGRPGGRSVRGRRTAAGR